MVDFHQKIRDWARGMYSVEAGAELLIRSGLIGDDASPWIHHDGDRAWIDAEALVDHSAGASGGQQRVIRLAASLLDGQPVNLADDVPGLDRENTRLVLAAVAHAAGSHEMSEARFGPDGVPVGFTRADALYAWPE